jgi:hypothetical protein
MNKLSKIAVVFSALLISLPVFAETGDGKPALRRLENRAEAVETRIENRVDRVETRTENREDRVENRTEKKASTSVEFKAKADAKRLTLINKYAENMLRVHKAARIVKIEAEKGINLDASEAKLVIARAKITTAETYVNGIMANVNAATGTPETVKTTVKGYFAISRENLKVAHQALVDVISSMKVGLNLNATTTTP